jgi:glycogen debranching enzyme
MITEWEIRSTERSVYAPYERLNERGGISFAAGFPHYPQNFSRDGFMAGFLANEPLLLESQLAISAQFQGTQYDANTGEEPGKIHHQLPGASLPGRPGLSTYNACDTTALFLIAAEGLAHLNPAASTTFVQTHTAQLQAAANYITTHLTPDHLFQERAPVGRSGYTLRVTYWKDSVLPNPAHAEPSYPIVYPQAHFVNARGLLAAGRLLSTPDYTALADRMYETGIAQFIRPDGYTAYRDASGEYTQASSDELHSLAYIPTAYAALLPLGAIRQRAAKLATPFGYYCTDPGAARRLRDSYHGSKVWVVDQAFIHYGASRFGLQREAGIAARIAPHIGHGQELFAIQRRDRGAPKLIPEGNDRQLWSVAAAEYFAGRSELANQPWL